MRILWLQSRAVAYVCLAQPIKYLMLHFNFGTHKYILEQWLRVLYIARTQFRLGAYFRIRIIRPELVSGSTMFVFVKCRALDRLPQMVFCFAGSEPNSYRCRNVFTWWMKDLFVCHAMQGSNGSFRMSDVCAWMLLVRFDVINPTSDVSVHIGISTMVSVILPRATKRQHNKI